MVQALGRFRASPSQAPADSSHSGYSGRRRYVAAATAAGAGTPILPYRRLLGRIELHGCSGALLVDGGAGLS
jgi:hypothetical protein